MSDLKQACRIWVGHIPKEASERDLHDKFSSFGSVRDIKYVETGQYDNYAFIQFEDRESAQTAISKDRLEICGKSVNVGAAKPAQGESRGDRNRRDRSSSRTRSSFYGSRRSRSRSRDHVRPSRVTISNLPNDMTWQELKKLAGDYVSSVKFARTWRQNDGISGTIECGDKWDCDKLISSLNGKKMEGSDYRLKLEIEEENSRGRERVRSEDRGGNRRKY